MQAGMRGRHCQAPGQVTITGTYGNWSGITVTGTCSSWNDFTITGTCGRWSKRGLHSGQWGVSLRVRSKSCTVTFGLFILYHPLTSPVLVPYMSDTTLIVLAVHIAYKFLVIDYFYVSCHRR
jgi:hypothetical protein